METLTPPDVQCYILFFASIIYAIALNWWRRNYPQSYIENTWLTVVIGVGYVLIALRTRFVLGEWLKICEYFAFAGTPIIIWCLVLHARNLREAEEILVRKGDERTTRTASKKTVADGSQSPSQGGDRKS